MYLKKNIEIKKHKLLIVSFSFYPDDSPNTTRWKDIINFWSEIGIEIFVVSAQKEGLSKFENVNGVKIFRTGRTLLYILKSKLSRRLKKDNIPFDNTKSDTDIFSKKSHIQKFFLFLWKRLYWPDWAFLFYNSALRESKKIIENEAITHLITISWPFTDHLVGYKLKNKYDLIWLTETIDPFCFNKEINNHRLYSKLNVFIERLILKKADLVSVTSERIRDKYISLFPEIKDKIHVIHNLYVPNETFPINSNIRNDSKSIKFVFMGTLSPGVRSPENLLKLFKKIIDSNLFVNPELHFYGKIHFGINSFYDYKGLINKYIFIHNFVNKNEVIDILLDANILINIGNSNPYQEPSKIVEYVYLGKPIINICSIDLDSSKVLLNQYPLNINIHKYDIDNEDIIKKIYEFSNKDLLVDRPTIERIIKPYMYEEVKNAYTKLLWNLQ